MHGEIARSGNCSAYAAIVEYIVVEEGRVVVLDNGRKLLKVAHANEVRLG